MKLIGSYTSPFVRKVRIVLAEKRISCAFVLEDVWSEQTRIADSNPLGQVPCLLLPGGEAMFDSRVIVEYLDAISDAQPLIPTAALDRAAVKTWEALADGVVESLVIARMERHWPSRPPAQQCEAWIARKLKKVEQGLSAMDAALGAQSYCYGGSFGLADVAVGVALGYADFRFPELDWRASNKNLARFQEGMAARASFVQTCPPRA